MVTVEAFEMSRTEVTVGQYRACVEAGACSQSDTGTYLEHGLYVQNRRETHHKDYVIWQVMFGNG